MRELEPGEMVIIDETGWRSVRPFDESVVQPRLCLFEFVYFARPDARFQHVSTKKLLDKAKLPKKRKLKARASP